MLQNFFNII